MYYDPIVEEMRNAGKKLQEKCNNNLHDFSRMLTEGTEKHREEGWKIVTRESIRKNEISENKR